MKKALRPEPARRTYAADSYDEIAENLKRIRSEVVLPCDVEPIALGTSRIACSRCAARGDWRGSLCNACAHYEPAAMTFTPAKGGPTAVSRVTSSRTERIFCIACDGFHGRNEEHRATPAHSWCGSLDCPYCGEDEDIPT